MKTLCKLFTIAMALLFVMASCEKDGVYNPKKKIDRIYYSFSSSEDSWMNTGKHVKEIWKWDKNLLKSITYCDENGEPMYTENYAYEKKRLSEITWGKNGKYTLIYDKKHLARIEYYSGNTLEETMVFSYDGKHLSEIKITNFDSKSVSAPMPAAIFRFFLPNFDEQCATQLLNRINTAKKTKSNESYTIKFEWDGKNIAKTIEDWGSNKYTNSYSYDNKKNPFKGLLDFDEFTYTEVYSANNVVKEITTYENEIDEYTYVYTYDGKYPVTKSYTYHDDDFSYSYTYYYEYK